MSLNIPPHSAKERQLFRLAATSSPQGMGAFLQSNPHIDLEVRDSEGRTPLHVAIRASNDDAAFSLMYGKVNKTNKDNQGRSILQDAIQTPGLSLWTMRQLACKNPDSLRTDSDGRTPLYAAIKANNSDAVSALTMNEAWKDPIARDKTGRSLLHAAIKASSSHSIIDTLARLSQNIEERDPEGLTALHAAVRAGNDGAAICLMSAYSASKNTSDETGTHLLHDVAKTCRDPKTIKQYILHNPGLEARDSEGLTPLHTAIRAGNEVAVNCLIDSGADTTVTSNDGSTLLYDALVASNSFSTLGRLAYSNPDVTFVAKAIERFYSK